MAESSRKDEESHATDWKPGHVRERDMQRVSEVDVADTGAESLPRDSQPGVKVQEKQNERSSGGSFAMRSTKREVFSVTSGRSRRWREEGRQRNWSGGEGRRRDRSGAVERRREGEQERETHTRETVVEMEEQGEGTKKNSLGKGDRNSEHLTGTNDQQRRQRNRERQRERDWRAKGRSDDKKTEREQHFAKQSRGGAVKKEVLDGQQQTNRDGSEKFVSDGSHSNAPARQRGGPKLTRNRARDMDRNWRERSEDDDGAKNEATGSTLPVKKREAMQPVTEGLQKLTREEGGRETEKKKSKKSGRSAPKKTSHPEDKQVVPTLQSSELTQQLSAGSYSCMVCCDRVRGRDAVWSCRGCYHVFHLECIRKWATSPASLLNDKDPSEGWRCPACQRASQTVPTLYQCYCRKITNPRPRSKGDLMAPHSCGELCGQNLARTPQSLCQHKCQLLCHPGPCPPCPVMVTRSCPCGRHDYQVRCSKTGDLPSCGSICGRKISCGRHHCDLACHAGSCPACEAVLTQRCHCGRNQRDVVCGKGEGERYGCGRTCGKELDCGNHLCELACHPLPCPSCTLLPSRVTSCPCGATPLSLLLSADHSRMSCLDPVPTCGATCGKLLPCSTRAEPHFCPVPCHEGSCPPCEKSRVVWCRCGRGNVRVDCTEMEGMGEYVCEKPCNKMKSCGRHRCTGRCCVDTSHQCDLVCGKRLQCGNHNCTETCHKGHCDQCWEYSYEELKCHCGGEVLYPPVACGTSPPSCNRPCARMHACEHTVTHSCHNEEECPPCTFLTVKMCMGEHEQRHNIPCHITDVSCGMACGRTLPCNNHKCLKTCHRDVCMDSVSQCRQPCQTVRRYCSHVCGEPCHVGTECPDVPCKAEVILTCKCGRRRERVVCGASSQGVMQQAFHKILSKDLGAKIRDLQSGQSVSLGHVTLASLGKDGETLDCNEVCLQVERNRALASALGIASPVLDPLEPSLPRYPGILMELARKDPEFASSVETELKSFVEMVMKGSTVQIRRHNFSNMFNKERKLIHELAPFYGCDSLSHGTEPQRYVTISTKKSSAKLPSVSLVAAMDREKFKAAPAPVNLPSERGSSLANISVRALRTSDSEDTGPSKDLETKDGGLPPDYFADDL